MDKSFDTRRDLTVCPFQRQTNYKKLSLHNEKQTRPKWLFKLSCRRIRQQCSELSCKSRAPTDLLMSVNAFNFCFHAIDKCHKAGMRQSEKRVKIPPVGSSEESTTDRKYHRKVKDPFLQKNRQIASEKRSRMIFAKVKKQQKELCQLAERVELLISSFHREKWANFRFLNGRADRSRQVMNDSLLYSCFLSHSVDTAENGTFGLLRHLKTWKLDEFEHEG